MYYLVFISLLDQSFKNISVIQKLKSARVRTHQKSPLFPIENWFLSVVFFLSTFKNLARSAKQGE